MKGETETDIQFNRKRKYEINSEKFFLSKVPLQLKIIHSKYLFHENIFKAEKHRFQFKNQFRRKKSLLVIFVTNSMRLLSVFLQ